MQAIQLSLLDLPTTGPNTPLVINTADQACSARLRQMANKMQSAIDAKKHSAIGQQRLTARRARIADAMRSEGLRLEQIQSWLYAMALAVQAGTLPDVLKGISQKTQLEVFLNLIEPKSSSERIQQIFSAESHADSRKKLQKAGIRSIGQLQAAIAALKFLHIAPTADPKQEQISQLERKLIGCDIPGYFPTPPAIVQQMIQLAGIYPGLRVLEPSAGKGDITDAIRAAGVEPDCIEVAESLRQILTVKQFNLRGRDFLESDPQPIYERILMNPPFEKGQDIQHVRWAYEWLVEGGRIVAIVSNGVSYRSLKKYQQFREWLGFVGASDHELPDGAFLESDRPTNVKTRLLVIDKSDAVTRQTS